MTNVVFGGRPGNLTPMGDHGEYWCDTRYLVSTETYHEWGIGLNNQPFDHFASVVWTYNRFAAVNPTIYLDGDRQDGNLLAGQPCLYTRLGNLPFPIEYCASPTGSQTNTEAECALNTAPTSIHGQAVYSASIEYHLTAHRSFTTPFNKPYTWEHLYGDLLRAYNQHTPAQFDANGDITIEGRSFRKYKNLLNYLDTDGAPKSIILTPDDVTQPPLYATQPFTSLVNSHVCNDCLCLFSTAAGPSPGLGHGPWTDDRYDPNLYTYLEADFGLPLGTSPNIGSTANPILMAYWSVIPNASINPACPVLFSGNPTFDHFTPGDWIRLHHTPIYRNTGGEGDEAPCTEQHAIDASEILFDPAPPTTAPAAPFQGYYEYGESAHCP
jgi:hypothetical protein